MENDMVMEYSEQIMNRSNLKELLEKLEIKLRATQGEIAESENLLEEKKSQFETAKKEKNKEKKRLEKLKLTQKEIEGQINAIENIVDKNLNNNLILARDPKIRLYHPKTGYTKYFANKNELLEWLNKEMPNLDQKYLKNNMSRWLNGGKPNKTCGLVFTKVNN